jgi:hypothetical protein
MQDPPKRSLVDIEPLAAVTEAIGNQDVVEPVLIEPPH